MIANKGVMTFGSGGKKTPVVDCVEADIESALMTLSQTKPLVVDVVRIHYGAKRCQGVGPQASQVDIALAMGVSLRTYRRYLSQGQDHIIQQLERRRT